MKLTTEQLRAAAKGAETVIEQKDGIHFERFTVAQRAVYQNNEDFLKKTYATAGVQLEFTTDSENLYLRTSISDGSSRTWFLFEIFANGERVGEIGNDDAETYGVFERNIALGAGMKTVRVYFPWSAKAVIEELSLDDGACFVPVKHMKKALIFGDSITQGYDARKPSCSYASLLADALGVDAYNKGIGGEVFNPALAAAEEPIKPDIITVAYGTNDWSRGSREEFEKNCAAFYATLSEKYPRAKIFAITPIWRKDYAKQAEWDFAAMSAYITKVADSLPNVTAIDALPFVPGEEKYFSDLWLHPNDDGFRYQFEGLFHAMLEHLA